MRTNLPRQGHAQGLGRQRKEGVTRMRRVTLTPFDPSRHLSLLTTWLHRPHVACWWGDPEQTLAAVQQHPITSEALVEVDARPVGFVCWQMPSQEELAAANLDDLPSDLVDLDILIGDPEVLGQGVGPAALSQVLAKLRADGVRVAGVGTAAANLRALRAFDKAGFRPFRDFQEAGCDMRYLVQNISAPV
jgi:RimJ/RimL family protein N-acetyltransferase